MNATNILFSLFFFAAYHKLYLFVWHTCYSIGKRGSILGYGRKQLLTIVAVFSYIIRYFSCGDISRVQVFYVKCVFSFHAVFSAGFCFSLAVLACCV